MINHITISVSSLEASKLFYDAALAPLGIKRLFDEEIYSGYGVDRPFFWIAEEDWQSKAHIAFEARSEDEVRKFHEAAMRAGGKDNGQPGPRPEYHENYYGAFILDPDGNNIEAVFGNS
jgi:catechol 2,3-dioxygenase-like lactoylglutathione lyase family enzyme